MDKVMTIGEKALAQAKEEVEDELVKKAVTVLKKKYKERKLAIQAVEHLNVEIKELEADIKANNFGAYL